MQDIQTLKSWVNDTNTSPDDLIEVGKTLVSRIGQLPPQHRDRFYAQVKNDPAFSKLLNTTNA